jgi:hypothetical protein
MRKLFRSGRLTAAVLTAAIAVAGVAGAALAAGVATDSRAAKKVRIKCPRKVRTGRKVTCRLFTRLPRGPRGRRGDEGPRGPRGQKGARGSRGPAGKTGRSGVSGYEVVSQVFKDVAVPNSGGQRGLSAVQTVQCPDGKRVVGGGSDLGTNDGQSAAQRQVTLSLSGPNGNGSGWSVQLFNTSTAADASIDLRIFAVCAAT